MLPSIRIIRTAVPESAYPQDLIGETILRQLDPNGKGARLLRRMYRHSGIDKRHSVIKDYRHGEGDGLFFDAEDGRFLSPSTKNRNDLYAREARRLFSATALQVLEAYPHIERDDVTHVITVSCTGFFAPGPDFYIVKDLALNPGTQRFHLGFMGCYGAFPALKLARSICMADAQAVVLIVCLELCTLHLEPSEDIDDLIATSVFSDGAAGAVVTGDGAHSGGISLRLDAMVSKVAPDSEADMAWTIGDHGFDMVLSTYVPRILEANVATIVDSMLEQAGLSFDDVRHWAIHPGGRAILDKVEVGLGLPGDALDCSRKVLREYGNMSSATILFVLEEMVSSGRLQRDDTVYAMAFGPGLTIESALMTVV